mmetsp:Transcript_2864/g.357  ORF Transcript_2864/g.357 Transcript_2864/m.357 type:complete len:96 (+) Transcript_2864:406-693(+)
MVYFMIPIIIFSIVLLLTPPFSKNFLFSYQNRGIEFNRLNDGFFVFLIFIEELILVYSVYRIRNANNDFEMTTELIVNTILWFILSLAFPFLDHY